MATELSTSDEITAAAIQFVKARAEAARLKAERAQLLSKGECSNGESAPPCYRTRAYESTWCERCRASQPAHVAYRKAVTRRISALGKLVRLVQTRKK